MNENGNLFEQSMNMKINENKNDIGKVSVRLNVWPSFLDHELSEKGELRKMNSGPSYFVWDDDSKTQLAMFNMDSPVTQIYNLNYYVHLVIF